MKKQIIFIIAALFSLTLISACSAKSATDKGAQNSENSYQTITAEEAKKMIDEGDVTIVDVREQDEYDEKHIPDAVLVPLGTIGDEQPSALPDTDAVLLVYCRSGNRSQTAAEKLSKLGYTNVYDFGGINDWPYDTVTEEG